MSVLTASEVRKAYADREILAGVSVSVADGERLGLVGRNGSGKTTLARILAGLEEPDAGQVTARRGARIAYLAQEPQMAPDDSAVDVVLAGLARWSAATRRHEHITAALQEAGADLDALLAEQAELTAEVERLGGWERGHQARAMLDHLGIADPDAAVGGMSGGERRRVAVAQLLVAQPDVAILDEPTNHLDIDTIEWLERYLSERFRGALVLITHDRYLLDRVVTRTLDIDAGALRSYDGGWGAYLEARAERQAHAARVETNRQAFLRRELAWLRRQPKARTTKQKARTARAEAAMQTSRPTAERAASMAVSATRSGRTVLVANQLAIAVDGRQLARGVTVNLGPGERIGIIGPNGCGKTTLVRTLLGEIPPASGTVTLGANARPVYLDQARSGLDDDATVFDNVVGGRSHLRLGGRDVNVHTYLEQFLFDSGTQARKAGTLSGGERARAALARVLSGDANLVVLDEPTNDLDVTTLAALEEALLGFPGTLLVVTHDRWFLDRIATAIWAFEAADGDAQATREAETAELVLVQGGYTRYQAYRDAREAQRTAERAARRAAAPRSSANTAAAAPASSAADASRRGLTYGERLELEGLMERVEAAEAQVAERERALETAAFYDRDHTEQAAFLRELADARAEAETLVARWLELESRREL